MTVKSDSRERAINSISATFFCNDTVRVGIHRNIKSVPRNQFSFPKKKFMMHFFLWKDDLTSSSRKKYREKSGFNEIDEPQLSM